MIDIWTSSFIDTLWLCLLVTLVSVTIGFVTAVSSWLSNHYFTFFIPLLLLSVPPWLFAFYLGDSFLILNPWLGSILSLGITCSVYPHSFIASSLYNRGHRDFELVSITVGQNLKGLFYAVYPSCKIAILPSVAVVCAEVVSDFGVVNYFGIQTLTMLTYSIWTSTWQFHLLIPGLVLLTVVCLFLAKLNLSTDKNLQITCDNTDIKRPAFAVLSIAPTLCVLLYIIIQSCLWIVNKNSLYEFNIENLFNSSLLVLTVSLISLIAVVFYMTMPFIKETFKKTGIFFYALPGTVIGAIYMFLGGGIVPLIILLILAIATRYFGLIIHTTATADNGNKDSYEILESYVENRWEKICLKLKMIFPAVSIGLCLIILDVLRELPISMILNPMNFSTLAMRMNYIATTEHTPSLAGYSLTLIGIGVTLSLIVIWLLHVTNKKPTDY